MPELPEVEVTRRGLACRLPGARIEAARPGKPLRWPLGIAPEALRGRTVASVGRIIIYNFIKTIDFHIFI